MSANVFSFKRRSLGVKIIEFFMFCFLLLGITLVFTAVANTKRMQTQYDTRLQEERSALLRDLSSSMRLTEAFAPDYSQWDDPYNYLLGKMPSYAEKNLTDDTLSTFESDAVWMFRSDGTQVFKKNNTEDKEGAINFAGMMPLIIEKFASNFAIKFNVKTKTGYMVVYGSTVVPTDDIYHKKKSPGFILVGKLVNDELLGTLRSEGRSVLQFIPGQIQSDLLKKFPARTGILSYEIPQYDISGNIIGVIYANHQDDSIKILHNSDMRLLAINMSSFLALLLALLFVVWIWVIRPMDKIRRGLEEGDAELLKKMTSDTSEFSNIAALINAYFEQERSLEVDIEEKRKLLKQLAAYNTEIEMTNNVMIGRELKMVEMKKEIESLKKKLVDKK